MNLATVERQRNRNTTATKGFASGGVILFVPHGTGCANLKHCASDQACLPAGRFSTG